jgi:diadenosine tetraphosphate (Ap4A) HIT family hydrolase
MEVIMIKTMQEIIQSKKPHSPQERLVNGFLFLEVVMCKPMQEIIQSIKQLSPQERKRTTVLLAEAAKTLNKQIKHFDAAKKRIMRLEASIKLISCGLEVVMCKPMQEIIQSIKQLSPQERKRTTVLLAEAAKTLNKQIKHFDAAKKRIMRLEALCNNQDMK